MWVSGAPERADGGDALLIVLTEIVDRVIAKSTKVPVLKLTLSASDDPDQACVIHLRSKSRGHRGRDETLELARRFVAFLRQADYDGAIPEELNVPMDLEAVPGEAVAELAQAMVPTDPKASLQRTNDTRRSRVTALLISVLLSLPVICCASSLWILGGAAGNDQVLYSMGDSLYKLGYPLTMIVTKFPDYAGRYLTTKDDLWAIPLVSLLFVVQLVIWGQLIVTGIRGLRAWHDQIR